MPEKHIQPVNRTSSRLNIQYNVPLKNKNWFKTGGDARFFCKPQTAQQFQQALQHAQKHDVPLFMLGEGANILVSDNGFAGLVVQPQLQEIKEITRDNDHVLIKAGAGARIHDVIEYCLAHNALGLEEFSGIPGTVGGAVYINLHYFDFLLEHFLNSAQVIDKQTHEIITVDRSWFKFGYNQSRLQEKKTLFAQCHICIEAM